MDGWLLEMRSVLKAGILSQRALAQSSWLAKDELRLLHGKAKLYGTSGRLDLCCAWIRLQTAGHLMSTNVTTLLEILSLWSYRLSNTPSASFIPRILPPHYSLRTTLEQNRPRPRSYSTLTCLLSPIRIARRYPSPLAALNTTGAGRRVRFSRI